MNLMPLPHENTTTRTPAAIDPTTTVNDVLRAYPATVGVFNAFGIDACCGGAATLADAAARDGAELDALLGALRYAAGGVR
jgi:regulator of cell morphogenesis and NO signaling